MSRPRLSKSLALPPIFIREWRAHRSMTQEGLAERVNHSTSSISQLESGKQGYSREMLAALARAFNCEVADLFRDPRKPGYQAWEIISRLRPERQNQALRVLRALEEEDVE